MSRCTNHYLPDGHKLTDGNGYTIAVLTNGKFERWQAGTWRPKSERVRSALKTFRAAFRSRSINRHF